MGDGELIEEAIDVLRRFGMGVGQLNVRSAMTLLALLQLKEGVPWSKAMNPMLGIRAIMDWIRDEFGVEYKPNTRETIRRQSLHQFLLAGLIEENADQQDKPPNSPKWNYRVTVDALQVIRDYGKPEFVSDVDSFLAVHTSFQSLVDERRDMPKTPVKLPSGRDIRLSPKGQSLLIKAMVEEMLPRFAPGCHVVYIDDADHQHGVIDADMMDKLGISLRAREKAPDVIAWDEERGWLFLMEAASTHGPVDVTRKAELYALFAEQWDKVVLVSCFPTRKIMQRYLSQLAWETEAWCADTPDHMIHLDGSRFMGPYEKIR